MGDATQCQSSRLREILDGEGIAYETHDLAAGAYQSREDATRWSNGALSYSFSEFYDGDEPVTTRLVSCATYGLDAEQALRATATRGECLNDDPGGNVFHCSACHFLYFKPKAIRFCPNCGRKVRNRVS